MVYGPHLFLRLAGPDLRSRSLHIQLLEATFIDFQSEVSLDFRRIAVKTFIQSQRQF